MTITKLLTVFDVYDNEADALAGFTGHGFKHCRAAVHVDVREIQFTQG
jgi:hypothetical protein